MRTDKNSDTEVSTTQTRLPPAQPLAVEDLSSAERAYVLAELLAHLPPEQERALRAYLAGFSHTETAALYGWSEAVARHRVYRGIQALKALAMQESL
jgi:DNA-directed RNA polymerase specialized sigma24 family protein